jgi:signal transduction histidine kinase
VVIVYSYQHKKNAHQISLNTLKLNHEKNLLKTQIEIQEQTFQNISREIHDNISLSLTLAKLNLNTLDWNNKDSTYRSVKSSINIIGSAITDLSNLSKSMNPELIRNLGLMKAVKNEIEKLEEMAHLQVTYSIEGEPIFMDSEKELVIFRIIQEAFNNILKHAQASCIWLYLSYNLNTLKIKVSDNGVGFLLNDINNIRNNKSGLSNMETRAKLFGGYFEIETFPGQGTTIFVTVPYN